MARYVRSKHFDKRAAKQLGPQDLAQAEEYLLKLGKAIPQSSLRLRPMEGHKDLWEMRAGGQNRFILRRAQDAQGDYFIVEDVGPHDIYRRWNMR